MRIIALAIAAVLLAAATPVSADPVPDCSDKTVSSGTSPEHTVTTHEDCTVDVELNKGIICVGAWGTTDVYTVGPVTITNHRCTFPGGDPGIGTSAAKPCGDTLYFQAATVYVFDDCTVRVDVKAYECFWGGYWHQHTPPPAEVREYRCGEPPY